MAIKYLDQPEDTQSQQQQKAIELCGGVVRGFTNKRGLYFRSGNLYNEQHRVPLFACYIQPDLKQDSFSSLRGVADSINMRYRYTDEKLHQSLIPDTALERFLFEMLEQLRVDSLVPDVYAGMKKNLLASFSRMVNAISSLWFNRHWRWYSYLHHFANCMVAAQLHFGDRRNRGYARTYACWYWPYDW